MRKPWVIGTATGLIVAVYVLDKVFSGIIGNRADAALLWVVTHINKTVVVPVWGLLLVFAILVAITLVAGILIRKQVNTLKGALEATIRVVAADESLLRLLPNIFSQAGRARSRAMKRVLSEYLNDSVRIFGRDVARASILLPNSTNQYLALWVGYQMPAQARGITRFYITESNPEKWGVAGDVFNSQKSCVVHIVQEGDKWAADHEKYIVNNRKRHNPPYRSFVAVPITSSTHKSLGVLCFDSMNPSLFDSPDIQEVLPMLARRIAVALIVYQNFEALHN